MAATSRRLGSGGCAVGASAGTGPRLLRGWGWGEGEGVGVGPLILAPFLLEHSFWGILGSSSVVTAGRRVFVSSAAGGWGWEFFTSACSSPRERAARNCPVLCCSWSITQYKSNEHAFGLSPVEKAFSATHGLPSRHQLHTSMRASHTSPTCSDTHNVGNTHRTAPHANAMGATLATARLGGPC